MAGPARSCVSETGRSGSRGLLYQPSWADPSILRPPLSLDSPAHDPLLPSISSPRWEHRASPPPAGSTRFGRNRCHRPPELDPAAPSNSPSYCEATIHGRPRSSTTSPPPTSLPSPSEAAAGLPALTACSVQFSPRGRAAQPTDACSSVTTECSPVVPSLQSAGAGDAVWCTWPCSWLLDLQVDALCASPTRCSLSSAQPVMKSRWVKKSC
ncbi:uncharacterized protein [Triticum aestivum]|uniref:uncharacterized protein n=1 Tax=Triticum aestivum TaxID=4565 RepID=UPI001D02AE98|nr:uncharacterized protein LOC123100263 [Triticum aestivum]